MYCRSADSYATDEDTSLVLDVLSNDTDNEPLAISKVSMPDYGSVALSGATQLVYTPANRVASYIAVFTYTASDGSLSDTATVTITVAADNDAPLADDDSFTVSEASLDNVLDVLAGDRDIEGGPLSVYAIGIPDNGGAVLNAGNYIAYTPVPSFHGVETFTYTVSDGYGGFDSALVTVTVLPLTYTLNVAIIGSGTVESDPPGDVYERGTPITLTAIASTGSTFTGWNGDCSGYGDCLLTMNANKQVTAAFGITLPVSVTLPISGMGQYDFGSLCGSVTLSDSGFITDPVTLITITLRYEYPTADFNGLPRRYDIETNGTGFQAALVLCYEQADLEAAGVTDELALHAYSYAGTYTWTQYSLVDPIANTVTAFGITEPGRFGLGVKNNQPTVITLENLKSMETLGVWDLVSIVAFGIGVAVVCRRRR